MKQRRDFWEDVKVFTVFFNLKVLNVNVRAFTLVSA